MKKHSATILTGTTAVLFALFSGASLANNNTFAFQICNNTQQVLAYTGDTLGKGTTLAPLAQTSIAPNECLVANLAMTANVYLDAQLTFKTSSNETITAHIFDPTKTYSGAPNFSISSSNSLYTLNVQGKSVAPQYNQLFLSKASTTLTA